MRSAFRPRRPLDLSESRAESTPGCARSPSLEQRDLVERDAQRLVPKILVLDVNCHAEQPSIACLELRQEILATTCRAVEVPKETERQDQSGVDQPPRCRRSILFFDSLVDVINRLTISVRRSSYKIEDGRPRFVRIALTEVGDHVIKIRHHLCRAGRDRPTSVKPRSQ